MEDEIKINEYVRTKDGHIAKYIEKIAKDEDVSDGMLFDNFIYEKYKHIRYSILKEIIVKHSKQLIDLIECGDIVEDEYGKYEVAFVKENKIYCNDYNYNDSLVILKEKDIKTILTKESYIANCYKVGGEDENRKTNKE